MTGISSSTTSMAKMTTTAEAEMMSRAGGGKTAGTPHLTQLREAHRRLGIAKRECHHVGRFWVHYQEK